MYRRTVRSWTPSTAAPRGCSASEARSARLPWASCGPVAATSASPPPHLRAAIAHAVRRGARHPGSRRDCRRRRDASPCCRDRRGTATRRPGGPQMSASARCRTGHRQAQKRMTKRFCSRLKGSGERASNPRPQAWEACALPTELPPRWADSRAFGGRSAVEWGAVWKRYGNVRPPSYSGTMFGRGRNHESELRSLRRELAELRAGPRRRDRAGSN